MSAASASRSSLCRLIRSDQWAAAAAAVRAGEAYGLRAGIRAARRDRRDLRIGSAAGAPAAGRHLGIHPQRTVHRTVRHAHSAQSAALLRGCAHTPGPCAHTGRGRQQVRSHARGVRHSATPDDVAALPASSAHPHPKTARGGPCAGVRACSVEGRERAARDWSALQIPIEVRGSGSARRPTPLAQGNLIEKAHARERELVGQGQLAAVPTPFRLRG
jgi:hypothetical protein